MNNKSLQKFCMIKTINCLALVHVWYLCLVECSRYFEAKRADDNPDVISDPDDVFQPNATMAPAVDYTVINASVDTTKGGTNVTGNTIIYVPKIELNGAIAMGIPYNVTIQEAPNVLPEIAEESNIHTNRFNQCVRVPEMGRFAQSSRAFVIQFQLRIGTVPFPNRIPIDENEPMVLKFEVKPVVDTGGTLKFALEIIKHRLVSESIMVNNMFRQNFVMKT